jgi:hypothetical protein
MARNERPSKSVDGLILPRRSNNDPQADNRLGPSGACIRADRHRCSFRQPLLAGGTSGADHGVGRFGFALGLERITALIPTGPWN